MFNPEEPTRRMGTDILDSRQFDLFPEFAAEKRKEKRKRIALALLALAILLALGSTAFAQERTPYVAGEVVEDHLMNFCANEEAASYVLSMQKKYDMTHAAVAFTEYAKYNICNTLIGDFIPMEVVEQVGMGHPLHGVWWVYIIKIHSPYTEDIGYLLTERQLLGEVHEVIIGGMDI